MVCKMKQILTSMPLLLKGLFLTVEVGIFSIALGLSLGLVLGVLSSNRMKIPVLSSCVHVYVSVMRGTPIFVQILLVYFALPTLIKINFSPSAAGILALGCNSAAYISEIVRCGMNAVGTGQWEAAYVLGYSKPQTLSSVILPQVLKQTLPALTNEITSLIKLTSLLMVIGVPELTKVGKDIVARQLDPMAIYLCIAVMYYLLTTSVGMLSHKLEEKLEK